MNITPRTDRTEVLREYFANAYLIALLKALAPSPMVAVEAGPTMARDQNQAAGAQADDCVRED